MANNAITVNPDNSVTITVHGRGSLDLPYTYSLNGQKIDISDWVVFFEVDGIPIREQLAPDPDDPMGLRIQLERQQVQTLKKTACKFSIIDETNIEAGLPDVLVDGVISRTGYVGEPDVTED